MIPPEAVERFRADLEQLTGGPPIRIGAAVSGGADSLALLLLASAAYPRRVEAATVDHGLRMESRAEAQHVAKICSRIGVQHATRRLTWPDPPGANIQARARDARYAELGSWALERGLPFVATAHHVDDQAETMLMRLARGSGVGGLAGVRSTKLLAFSSETETVVHLVRPVLRWRREGLARILAAAGLAPVDDPTNSDDRFDRTRVRGFLAEHDLLPADRLADTAAYLAEAEEALDWMARELFAQRHVYNEDGSILLDPHDLPRELQRRLLLQALSFFIGCAEPAGPKVSRLLDTLRQGHSGMLADVQVHAGDKWRLDWAPPRRT
jgi:tRNA(Ile)-lysidine synthase